MALLGCTDVVVIQPLSGPDAETSGTWGGLRRADLDALGEYLADSECDPTGAGKNRSFHDFSIVADQNQAVFAASLCTQQNTRILGRRYVPVSAGGTGWEPAGSHTSFIESAGAVMVDLALAISSGGSFLSAFWNWTGVAPTTLRSAAHLPDTGWDYFQSRVFPVADIPDDVDSRFGASPIAGQNKALAFDASGNAYLAYSGAAKTFVKRYIPYTGWASDTLATLDLVQAQQIAALDDGLGTTVIWSITEGAPQVYRLKSAWSLDPDGDTFKWETDLFEDGAARLATTDGTLTPWNAATDQQGNILVLYYDQDATVNPALCDPLADQCELRLYALVRNSSGSWSGPTQVDEFLRGRARSTTYYQDTAVVGGRAVAPPGLAYLGGGRFLVAWAVNDVADDDAPVTHIYTRGYTVGSGWDPESAVETIFSNYLVADLGDDFTAYRAINTLKLVANTEGGALLMFQYVSQADGDGFAGEVATRSFRWGALRREGTAGWDAQGTSVSLNGYACPVQDDQGLFTGCNSLWVEGAVFSAEASEAVIVFPTVLSDDLADVQLGLWSVRYVQGE